MKKYVSLLLTLAMVLSLAGCGSKDKGGDWKDPRPTETVEPADDYDPTDDWSDEDWEDVEYSKTVDTPDVGVRMFVNYAKGDGWSEYRDTDNGRFSMPKPEAVDPGEFDPSTVTMDDVFAIMGTDGYKHWWRSFGYEPYLNDENDMGIECTESIDWPLSVSISRDVDGGLAWMTVGESEYGDTDEAAWDALEQWIAGGDYGRFTWTEGGTWMHQRAAGVPDGEYEHPAIIDGYAWTYNPDSRYFRIAKADEERHGNAGEAGSCAEGLRLLDEALSRNGFLGEMFGDWLSLEEAVKVASGEVEQDHNKEVSLKFSDRGTDVPGESGGRYMERYVSVDMAWKNGVYFDEYDTPRESAHGKHATVMMDPEGDGQSVRVMASEDWDYFANTEAEARKWLEGKLSEFGCSDFEWTDEETWEAWSMSGDGKKGYGTGMKTIFPELQGLRCRITGALYSKDENEWAAEFDVDY